MDTELVQILQRMQTELRQELSASRSSFEAGLIRLQDRHQDVITALQSETTRLSVQVVTVQTELAAMRERAKADARMLQGQMETLSKSAGAQLLEHEEAIDKLGSDVTSLNIRWNRVIGIMIGATLAGGAAGGGIAAALNAVLHSPK